ncbi:hypothetical protein Pth03_11480 [Planotetraspora thailandica]|uniref:ATP-grasp domain-containing protein n=1 Tax=Planotetraspora thailandica TaxID=487172 RepID=A0A8J3XU15_9ACTN|nr:ATP-grasp domain-containing protein [Planotetraspora thailandica]GII52759.1 hypothetical protein Pth03_11480 [Planotetraspora thailandica]
MDLSVPPAGNAGHALDSCGDVVLVDPAMTGRGFKNACARRGLRVIALYTLTPDFLSSVDPFYESGDALTFYLSSVEAARDALPRPVRAVIPTTEPSVLVGDQLGAALDLPGNPVETSGARRDKTAMRRHATAHGLRVPAFEVVGADGFAAAAERIGYPAILKPATGAGSHGVTVLPDASALVAATQRLDAFDLFGNRLENWTIEQYVRGRELAVNTFSVDGRHRVLDIWEYRQPSSADYDQPYWDVVQVPRADPDWARAAEFVVDVLDAFRVQLGPGHTEIKVDAAGPCLIEMATRLPGAHMVDQWAAHSAIRPYDDTLAVFLGEDPGLLDRDLAFDAALGICCIRNDDRPGTLRSIRGLDEVKRIPGVGDVYTDLVPGDFVPLTRDLGSLVAFVLVSGPDLEAVDRLLSQVRSTVRLELM